jgi:transposase
VTVACEPAGHRWRVLDQLAAGRGLALVCAQPLLVYRAREGEDLTRDKSGPKDAVILAGTGDPARFASPRALVKHAGLCPRDNASGAFHGNTPISGRGRPRLRAAAWRALWAALPDNPVMAARFTHLTTREDNRLARQQARTAAAAALLRWIHAVTTRKASWDPAIAASGTPAQQAA